MILQYNDGMFDYREHNSNLFCFSLAELIAQTRLIYKKDLLTILN